MVKKNSLSKNAFNESGNTPAETRSTSGGLSKFEKIILPTRESNFFEEILEKGSESQLILDSDLRVIFANSSFYKNFKVAERETIGKLIYELGNNQWDIPKLRALLEGILPEKQRITDFLVEHDFETIGERVMLMNAQQKVTQDGKQKLIVVEIIDITIQKKTEEQLRFQAQMNDNSFIIVAFHDKNLNTVWANKAYQKATGLSLEEIRGKKCYLVWNLQEPCRGCPVITAIETGERASNEMTPDNQDNWPETQGYWQSEATPVRDELGAIIGAIEYAFDITERKRAEKEINFLSRFPQENPNPVMRISCQGEILYANQTAGIFLKNWEKKVGQVLPMPIKKDVLNTLQDKQNLNIELTCGEKIFLVTLAPIIEEKYVNFYGSDITERKQAEVALRANEEKYRKLYESMMDAFVSVDMTGKIHEFNQAYCDMLGYTGEELFQLTYTDLTPEKWHAFEAEIITTQILKRGFSDVYEKEYRKKDGNVFSIELRTILIRDESGQSSGMWAIIRDITKRKQAEKEIYNLNAELEQRVVQRTAQLESANQELDAFSYSVSHDLRAPLRGIDGWSLALMEDYGSQLDGKAKTYLERVRAETQHMGQLIDDLLQLSRLNTIEMSQELLDLSAIAGKIAAQIQTAQPDRKVKVVIQPGLKAKGDARLLEIALTNLLDNAFKFTGKTPQANIRFGKTQMDGQPAFFVRDNGAGFDMAYAKKLFGAFQRMHSTSDFPGSGIGLTTVQRIIHRHGGRIWAEAAVNKGATFYFTLKEIS